MICRALLTSYFLSPRQRVDLTHVVISGPYFLLKRRRQLHTHCSRKNSSCWKSHPISHQPRMGSDLIHNCETCFNVSELFIVDISLTLFLSQVRSVRGGRIFVYSFCSFTFFLSTTHTHRLSVLLLLLAASPNDEV